LALAQSISIALINEITTNPLTKNKQ